MSNSESLLSFLRTANLVQNTMQKHHPLYHFDVASTARMEVKVVFCLSRLDHSPAQTQQLVFLAREAMTDEPQPSGTYKSLKSN